MGLEDLMESLVIVFCRVSGSSRVTGVRKVSGVSGVTGD